jgi:hypothetical protein
MNEIVDKVRAIIVSVSPEIREETKWNAPSFRTTEHFATFNLKDKKFVRLILHRGAKVRTDKPKKIADPSGILEWRGDDRAVVTFTDLADVAKKSGALKTILRAWMSQL